MAQQEQKQQITTHEYSLKTKYDGEKSSLTIYVSDTITKRRWEDTYNKEAFQNQDVKGVFDGIKNALNTQPPSFKCTYPEQQGANLAVDIQNGTYSFSLKEVQYNPNDV